MGGWTSSLRAFALVGEVAVAQNRDGRLEAFGWDIHTAIQYIRQVSPGGAWGSWTSLGGSFVGRPIVGVNSDGRIELFARASDKTIQHTWQVVPNADGRRGLHLDANLICHTSDGLVFQLLAVAVPGNRESCGRVT